MFGQIAFEGYEAKKSSYFKWNYFAPCPYPSTLSSLGATLLHDVIHTMQYIILVDALATIPANSNDPRWTEKFCL